MADQGNITTANAADLNAAARRYAASQGWALPDGGYPVRPANLHGASDLSSAVRAVGRASLNSAPTVRKHIMARASAINLKTAIPDTWKADGSLAGTRMASEPATYYRSYEPDMQIKPDGTGRTLVGIAVPFNREQQIDENLREAFDSHSLDDQIPAMHRVPAYRGHRRSGGVHIGHISYARADAAGLYSEIKTAATPAGDETLELHRNGSLPDLSVGFVVPRGGTQIRNGTEWRMRARLTELAVVPVGAYGDWASIAGVRSVSDLGVNGYAVDQGNQLDDGKDGDFTAAGDAEDKLAPCPNCGYVAGSADGEMRERLERVKRLGLELPRFLPM